MCEHSSVNLAANLREVRRRKILENSENRLKLIEGISSLPGRTSSETHLERKPESELKPVNLCDETSSCDLNSKLNDVFNVKEDLKDISDFMLWDKIKVREENIVDKEEEEDLEVQEVEDKKGFQIFLQKKLHYVLLALTVNVLLLFNAGFLFYENIFCPFYTVKIIELFLGVKEEKDLQLLSSLFLVSVPKSIQKFSKVVSFLVYLLSDLCVYLYTFIIAAKFIN